MTETHRRPNPGLDAERFAKQRLGALAKVEDRKSVV